MLSKLITYFGLQQFLIIALIFAFVIGMIPGCYLGGVSSYKSGYNKGYTDAKADKRQKLFPNIWKMFSVMPEEIKASPAEE